MKQCENQSVSQIRFTGSLINPLTKQNKTKRNKTKQNKRKCDSQNKKANEHISKQITYYKTRKMGLEPHSIFDKLLLYKIFNRPRLYIRYNKSDELVSSLNFELR